MLDELYGMDPAGFTARRDALAASARKNGDRALAAAVKALRRPSAAAHAVNLMARRRGQEIDRLIELGQRLREAQEALAGDELRALGRQRHQVIAGLAQEARADSRAAGLNLSDAAQREVESTFEAALGDEAAADAVRSGRLVRALERTGLDPVDVEGAVAGGGPAAPRTAAARQTAAAPRTAATPRTAAARQTPPSEDRRTETRTAARTQAESDLAQAEQAVARTTAAAEQAEHDLARAETEHDAAARSQAEADEEVGRLKERLAAARDEADRAADAERASRRARKEAEDAARSARREADAAAQARERAADRLRRL